MTKTLRIRFALLGAIVVIALVAFGKDAVEAVRGWGAANDDTVPVLVADGYIPPFQIIRSAGVTMRRYPREFVPVGALQNTTELLKDNGQPLYVSVVGIPDGQPLTRMVLSEAGRERGMSSLLKPGKVAVSFQVDRARAAGGWVRPGDTIALFHNLSSEAVLRHGGHFDTELLLESVQVLAVDHEHVGEKPDSDRDGMSPDVRALTQAEADSQTITVLANTQEAALIVEARERGSLSVVLRSMGDDMPWYGGKTKPS